MEQGQQTFILCFIFSTSGMSLKLMLYLLMHSGSEDFQQKLLLFLAMSLSGRMLKLLDLNFRKSGTQGILPFPLKHRQMNEVTRYKSVQLLGSCSSESQSHCKDSLKIGNEANPSTAKTHLTPHHLNRQKPKLFLTSKLILRRLSQHMHFLWGLPHLETKTNRQSYAFCKK